MRNKERQSTMNIKEHKKPAKLDVNYELRIFVFANAGCFGLGGTGGKK